MNAVECFRDAEQVRQEKIAEMKRNEEQKWVRPPSNIAAGISILPSSPAVSQCPLATTPSSTNPQLN